MKTLGLDIGGANLKAAHSDGLSRSVPFELWEDPAKLSEALQALIHTVPAFDRLALTMTAELCDCFETKREGVAHILKSVHLLAPETPIHVWLNEGRFADLIEARSKPMLCAASNWHALATWVAGEYPIGVTLLIDTGSTTTDIVKLIGGKVNTNSLNDTQRLLSGELVYLGATRTPAAALGPTVEFKGATYPIMMEGFATTADIFLLTGHIPAKPELADTSDGRPLTRRYSAARLARMIGADLDMITADEAEQLARSFADTVCNRIAEGIVKVINVPNAPRTTRIVICGSGAFVAEQAAQRVLERTPIESLATQIGKDAADAACAYAVMKLLDKKK